MTSAVMLAGPWTFINSMSTVNILKSISYSSIRIKDINIAIVESFVGVFSNCFPNVYNTTLRNFAGRQILAIYLSSKSFKQVLKCGQIHILQTKQLNLQFTPNSQDDGIWMFWIC